MKVLILSEAADTGGVGYQLKRALEAHTAWTATQAVRSLNYIDYPRDVLWPVGDPLPDRLRTAFAEADVVHVMERWDACRAFDGWTDKPLVLHHHGSILRSNWRVLTQGAVELRAERVVSTPDLALIDPGAEWLPNPVDGGDLARRTGRPDRSPRPFTVFHSPTSAMKGTEALERAAAEAGVATDVVRGVPWTVALARKRTADAVFDQLALGYGLAGLEAMAMGVPVVSGASDPDGVMRGVGVPGGGHLTEALAAMFGYLPYLSATPGTLADRLREIATDGTLRDRVRDLGLYHAWRWHRPQAVAEQLARVYERAIEAKR